VVQVDRWATGAGVRLVGVDNEAGIDTVIDFLRDPAGGGGAERGRGGRGGGGGGGAAGRGGARGGWGGARGRGGGAQRIVFVGRRAGNLRRDERLGAFALRARPGDSEILMSHFSTSPVGSGQAAAPGR